uniref:Gag-Pol polyprotein n=1 Tax=Tanacetum cinerariifolium TaxID=118510 RepID=A0A6L2NLY2_TANCI|nr:hypothetical protein [Tanacetum cinerariifolium]
MIPGPGDANREITVTETFHLQTDDEFSDKELKQIKADDQAIQTILRGLPKNIYAAVDSCETAQEIWLRVQQMMKGSDIGIQEKKAKLFNEWERFTSNEGESTESYYHRFLKLMNDLKRNKHFPKKIASNLKFLNNLQPEWSRHVTIVHQTKDLHTADYTQLYDFLKYNQKEVDELKAERIAKTQDPLALMAKSNNPYRISSNPRNRQIAQPGMNMGQDRQMQMVVGGNGRNQFRQYAGNPAGYNDVIGNQNQIGNGNLVAARAEGNAAGQNGNQISKRDLENFVNLPSRAKVMTIKESKDFTSLSLDELIGNLKVYEIIIKKDSKIVKAKGERKSLALKAKKESNDEECSTSKSKDEEYTMVVRDFKKFFKRIDKNQRAFVDGSWSDSGEEDDEKAKDETCLVAQTSNES